VLVVTDVTALRRAQQTLESMNFDLESRVRRRTRELDDTNRELRLEVTRRTLAEEKLLISRNNLALLSEQLIQAQESERRRIASELHDSVGQSLSAVKYSLERAVIMVQRKELGNPEAVLTMAVKRLMEAADSIRSISTNLRPPMLDDLGAVSAVQWFCQCFAETYPGIAVHVDITVQNAHVPRRIATHLFRAVQELLNNVAKHSGAGNAGIILERVELLLTLRIWDDGVGMGAASNPGALHGAGLRNLRERAGMTGGRFSVASRAQGGSLAQIEWTLDPAETGD